MWKTDWRKQTWGDLDQPWDIIVIGGGITGAGILLEAALSGYRTLLLEAKDFSAGTSSRSSKLVHGGLRYLRQAQLHLTRECVLERNRLIDTRAGLVSPLSVYGASIRGDKTPSWVYGLGLFIYDILSGKWDHQKLSPDALQKHFPLLKGANVYAGHQYYDAQTNDSRLVVRILKDAVRAGATALNYSPVIELLQTNAGQVRGVVVQDATNPSLTKEVQAGLVINATGVWADDIRVKMKHSRMLRAIRGSHLVFSKDTLPLTEALTFFHPRDNRAVFAVPWQNAILVGTTDVDHKESLDIEPAISSSESEYILELLKRVFPEHPLELSDAIASYAGVRPVINSGKSDPSKESREHIVFLENGLLTIAGGKLTTFRLMARQALKKGRSLLPKRSPYVQTKTTDVFDPSDININQLESIRLQSYYGPESADLLNYLRQDSTMIPGTPMFWAELEWAATADGVVKLSDLLLRRSRMGITVADGGRAIMPEIRRRVQNLLEWDDATWDKEESAYFETLKHAYRP